MTLAEMMQERRKLLTDMQALNDRTTFNAEEREQWDKMDARYTELDGMIDREQRSARIASELAKPAYQPKLSIPENRGGTVAGTPEYRDAFVKTLRTGDMSHVRALTTATSNAPVPLDMQRRIVEMVQKDVVLRQYATILNVASDQQITIQNAIPTAYLVDEAAAATESTGTFTRKTIGDFTFIGRSEITWQGLQDYIGGGDYLARGLASALALKEEDEWINGDAAAGPPQRMTGIDKILQTADNKIVFTAGSSGQGWDTLAADNIIDLVHKVAPQYRRGPSFRFLMNDTAAKSVRKLKDGSNRYLWQVSDTVAEGLTNGINGTLYGVPVSICQSLPTATTAGASAMYIGDWRYLEVYDRGGVEFTIDNLTGLSSLKTYLQTWKRNDITIVNTNAFAHAEFK